MASLPHLHPSYYERRTTTDPPQAKIWTPERNERLLLLVISNIKVDAKALAEAWKGQYGNVDDFKPTPRAISEQFGVLKKKSGKKGKTTNPGPSTPKTPRSTKATPSKSTKAAAAATPSKRKKSYVSDEESGPHDEDDSELDLKSLPPALSRTSLARSKKVRKRYEESVSEDEKADDESDDMPIKDKAKKSVAARASAEHVCPMTGFFDGDEIHVAGGKPKAVASRPDSVMGDAVPAVRKSALKNVAEMDIFDDDSDVSDFAKSLG